MVASYWDSCEIGNPSLQPRKQVKPASQGIFQNQGKQCGLTILKILCFPFWFVFMGLDMQGTWICMYIPLDWNYIAEK